MTADVSASGHAAGTGAVRGSDSSVRDVHESGQSAGVKAIAYYLPQFYPNRWNDEWWGPGFTEWTNVAKARPLYPGHRQPNLPSELGFYDLRLPETRELQAQLARDHGIHGFCYWHYWLGHGRRMLERPFADVLASGEPDFPFCLGWANHSWTGAWHGAQDRVLVEQQYPGGDDDRRHFELLLPALVDPRYVRVDGRPLVIIYVPYGLPDPERLTELWRTLALEAGLPGLFLVGRTKSEWDPTRFGFDASVTSGLVPPYFNRLRSDPGARSRPDWLLSAATRRSRLMPAIYSYRRWSPFIPWLLDGTQSFPTVVPRWDNTPRAGRSGAVYEGSSPERFADQVRQAVAQVADRPSEHRLLFVQSWNEWAEGNYLEPDHRYGRGYVEALRDALGRSFTSSRSIST